MSCQTLARVLAHSVGHADAPPITSFQLRYPLQIHAELMTHRMFSRNARSSRAVPTLRMLEEVRTAPFIPRYWGANQKGMQGGAEHDALVNLPGKHDLWNEKAWLWARDRAAEAAEPHIRDLAIAMKEALAQAGPATKLEPGQWHLPYVRELGKRPTFHHPQHRLVKQSVTRCAQVSYVPFHEAKLTPEEEEARHDALVAARPMHASPCEHQATPDRKLPDGSWEHPELAGNLGPGWIQYRKTLEGERA